MHEIPVLTSESNTYFRLSWFQSSPLIIHFRDGPNTCSHCTKVWHKTYPICDAPSFKIGACQLGFVEVIDLFTDTAAILNQGALWDAKGGISTIQCTRISIYVRFSGQFFLKFSQKKIVQCNGKKKIVVPCLDVIMIPVFPRNIYIKVSLPEKRA